MRLHFEDRANEAEAKITEAQKTIADLRAVVDLFHGAAWAGDEHGPVTQWAFGQLQVAYDMACRLLQSTEKGEGET